MLSISGVAAAVVVNRDATNSIAERA